MWYNFLHVIPGLLFQIVFFMTSHLSALNSNCQFTAQSLRILLFAYATVNDSVSSTGSTRALLALFARLFRKHLALHTHDQIYAGSETATFLELRTHPIAGRTLFAGKECPLITVN